MTSSEYRKFIGRINVLALTWRQKKEIRGLFLDIIWRANEKEIKNEKND